mmetsp:Transcript_86725/g.137592  ORF Transcript_86725/g.137592 Transcript_86725/m.137592 type:complete len:372 (+) Transcript_86725:77-1192(+)
MTVIKSTSLGQYPTLVLPHWLALTFSLLIFVGLGYAYRSHGIKGVGAISTQVLAIVFVQLSTKLVLQHGFPYPTCIALVHFSLVWLVSSFMTRVDWKRYFVDKEELVRDAAWYGRRILPIAVLQTANVVMNTTSLKYIGAGFNSIIGILSPVLTALISALLGRRFAALAWLGIVIAIAGDAVISCEGVRNLSVAGQSTSLALLGMMLGIGALFARSIRSVLMDCQMNQYESDEDCPKLSPLQLVALTSPAVFCFGLVITLAVEGLEPFFAMPHMRPTAAVLLAVSAFCAVFLSIMGMFLIKMLGAAAAQIAGKMNILLTVSVSSSFMGERLTLPFVVGSAMVLLGASIFAQMKDLAPEKTTSAKPTTYNTV